MSKKTTDNKGCANPPKSLREYYLGEGEFDFERKIKKEMITDSPGKYSEEYQALKKFGSDKADCTKSKNRPISDFKPIKVVDPFNETTDNASCCTNCDFKEIVHTKEGLDSIGFFDNEHAKKTMGVCDKFISSNKEKSK